LLVLVFIPSLITLRAGRSGFGSSVGARDLSALENVQTDSGATQTPIQWVLWFFSGVILLLLLLLLLLIIIIIIIIKVR
jgi:hypothetical protein